MAQVNLTESKIREIYSSFTGEQNISQSINDIKNLNSISLEENQLYVVKADVLISGRLKKGMIKIGLKKDEAIDFIKNNFGLMANAFIIQQLLNIEQEKYLSIETFDEYDLLRYSEKGGVEIESNWDSVKEYKIPLIGDFDFSVTPYPEHFKKIYQLFLEKGFAFLEINPFTFIENQFIPVDFKGRIDTCHKDNYKYEQGNIENESEQIIHDLDMTTGASLKFTLLNKNAKIWPMIAGGGASIVYFDLIASKFGIENVGFYGEYSGNPTTELTYAYALEVIKNALKSSAKDKILLIAGGNANFTDIPKTFNGIIDALKDNIQSIKKDGMEVVVRRAGPNDIKGLKKMKDFLDQNGIKNQVNGIEMDMWNVFDYQNTK